GAPHVLTTVWATTTAAAPSPHDAHALRESFNSANEFASSNSVRIAAEAKEESGPVGPSTRQRAARPEGHPPCGWRRRPVANSSSVAQSLRESFNSANQFASANSLDSAAEAKEESGPVGPSTRQRAARPKGHPPCGWRRRPSLLH